MKLYPKARPVRIKLMVGDEEHSSLDSLLNNFDVREIIKLHETGGLKNWLLQIHKEELWDNMNQLEGLPLLEKYAATYNIFFPESHISLTDRLLFLQHNHYNSFKKLFHLLINQPGFSLPVEVLNLLFQRSAQLNDDQTLEAISRYVFHITDTKLREIIKLHDCLNHKELPALIKQMADQWNVNIPDKSTSSLMCGNLNRIIDTINSSPLLLRSKYKLQIGPYLKSTQSTYIQSSTSEHIELEKAFKKLKAITRNREDVHVISYDETYWSVGIETYYVYFIKGYAWCNIRSTLNNLTTKLLSEKLSNWEIAIKKIYIISLLLKSKIKLLKMTEYDNLIEFFHEYGGVSSLKQEQIYFNSYINASLLEVSNGINKFILQSVLFAGVLGYHRHENSISDLIESGYRPAQLLAGKVAPLTKLEEQFLKEDDFGKLHLLIENNFDLSQDGKRD